MSSVDKYREMLAKLNKPKRGGSGNDYIDLVEGKNVVRLLPGHPSMDNFYVEVFYHKRKVGQKNVSVVCPNGGDEDGGNCPICEQLEGMRRSKDKKQKDLYYSWRAKPRFFVNAISRADDELKVKVLAFGSTILKQVLEVLVDPDEFGDILDPKEGTDIIIKKTGSGLDTEYAVTPRRTPGPLSDDPKQIKAIIGKSAETTQLIDLSNLGASSLSEEDILKLWDGHDLKEDDEDEAPKKGKKPSKPVEDEDEDEEEEAPKPKKGKKPSKPVDEDDDEDEDEAPKKAPKKPASKKVDDDDDDDEEDLEDVLKRHAKPTAKKGK